MIRAGNIEHRRATNAVFLRHADSDFHFRQLAGNDDLTRRIDVGNIDIFIRGQPAHIVFLPADHGRHRASRLRTLHP